MTVKEVAKALRVCMATVYSMIEWGELEHMRVSNAIRVVLGLPGHHAHVDRHPLV